MFATDSAKARHLHQVGDALGHSFSAHNPSEDPIDSSRAHSSSPKIRAHCSCGWRGTVKQEDNWITATTEWYETHVVLLRGSSETEHRLEAA